MKKHLKKAATVLACTGMVAGAFTTTAFAEDAEQITLNVSHIFVDQTDGQCRGWYKALDEYKESHPNITIVEDTADNDAYKTKLKTQLAAGAVPDVFYAWGGGFTKPFVEAGMVENLDPYVEDGTIDLDAMMPDICNNFYYDGSLYGLPLDTLLGVLGLESLQRSWLGDVNTALFSAFVPIIWQNVGYHMLLLYTSINSISKDILEAAKLDGASGVKAARYITIPLVKPMLRTCAIFVVIGSLKAFDMIYVLTNGGPAHMTEVPSSLMFSSIFNLNKYGYGSAISIFIVVECIVMAVILQKVFLVKEESA